MRTAFRILIFTLLPNLFNGVCAMAGLSILIPVEAHETSPLVIIETAAAKPALDIEVLIVPASTAIAERLDLAALTALDPRVRVIAASNDELPTLALWSKAVSAATGQWVTLLRPDDIFEPETLHVANFAKAGFGGADAIAWNALQISPLAERGKASSVGIPTNFGVVEFDKTDLLKSFFLWEGAGAVPKVPFGLYHGILARELAESIANTIAASGREHTLAQWEWTARTVLMGEKFAFCARPFSVINIKPWKAPAQPLARAEFAFHSGIGQTAGIAEIQHAVFAEMGALWTGAEVNFIRACLYDCMFEFEPQAFNDKCNNYYRAVLNWEGGVHAQLFKPQFAGERPLDTRRGLHGTTLMIDRHIAGASNAQEFYKVIRDFLAPVGIICGAKAI
jgi:hypothetical protein